MQILWMIQFNLHLWVPISYHIPQWYIRFILLPYQQHSSDGDQCYPGGIEVMATYSLTSGSTNNGGRGVQLQLAMTAKLKPGETKATPISLAQHSYFNLASHSSPERILDHVLKMPNCDSFTPVDSTSIPTGAICMWRTQLWIFEQGWSCLMH